MTDSKKTAPGPWLAERLDEVGTKAFRELCVLGCDADVLGGLFALLASPSTLHIGDSSKTRKITLRSLDDLETALGGLTRRQLQSVAQRASRLKNDIERLRRTSLVLSLVQQGLIGRGDLLAGSTLPVDLGFDGLVNLPNWARQVGRLKRPDYTRLLTKIYTHIRQNSGQWHDRLVADVLSSLAPAALAKDSPINEFSLKEWRKRHGLTH